MKEPVLLIGNVYAVEVDQDAVKPCLAVHDGLNIVWDKLDGWRGFVEIPPGNWKLICLSDEVTEEIAAGFVEIDEVELYKDYVYIGYSDTFHFQTAIESYQSLMKSLGLTSRYAIIEKIK